MNRFTLSRRHRNATKRPAHARPVLELLEDRTVLSSYTAATVADLIKDINLANHYGGSNTITLATCKTFTMTKADNPTNGGNGLPAIAAKNNLTIQGNGDTLTRSTAAGTPAFRLFDVVSGAALTLKNLTIANGLLVGGTGAEADGGAVLVEAGGSLTASYTTFAGNQVAGGDGGGGPGGMGHGGAIENEGTASFDHDTFTANQAVGGATTDGADVTPNTIYGSVFGAAFGGAIGDGSQSTLVVSCSSFAGNQAIGGLRHADSSLYDGVGASGAIDRWNAATISDTTFAGNKAIGGPADPEVDGGYGIGGAVGSGGPFPVSSAMTILRCAFSGNQAIGADADPDSANGAGIGGAVSNGYSQVGSTMTVTDSTFIVPGQPGHRGQRRGILLRRGHL